VMAVGALLSATLSAVGLNAAYVNWHDTHNDARYILKSDAMTIAAADTLGKRVDDLQAQSQANADQLDVIESKSDFLLIQAAQREVYDAEIALQVIEKNAEQTLQYHDLKRDAVSRLDTAKALLTCFRAGQINCSDIRGF